MNNIYYNPEKFGLTQICLIDYSDGSYQFDYRAVWLHTESNRYYTARSAGCSCPTPFEEYNSVSELEEFGYWVIDEAMNESKNSSYSGDPVFEFIENCKNILNPTKTRDKYKIL